MISQTQSHYPLQQRLMLVPQGNSSSADWRHSHSLVNESDAVSLEDSQRQGAGFSQPLRRQSFRQRQNNNNRHHQQQGHYHQNSSSDYSAMFHAVSTVLPSLFETTPLNTSSSSAGLSAPLESYDHRGSLHHHHLSKKNSFQRTLQQPNRHAPTSMVRGGVTYQQAGMENIANGPNFHDQHYHGNHHYHQQGQEQEKEQEYDRSQCYPKQASFSANSPNKQRRSVDLHQAGNTVLCYGKNSNSLPLGFKKQQQQLSAPSATSQTVRSLPQVPGFYFLPSSEAPKLIAPPNPTGCGYPNTMTTNPVSSSVIGVPLRSQTSFHNEEVITDPMYHSKNSFMNRRQHAYMNDMVQHHQHNKIHNKNYNNHSYKNNHKNSSEDHKNGNDNHITGSENHKTDNDNYKTGNDNHKNSNDNNKNKYKSINDNNHKNNNHNENGDYNKDNGARKSSESNNYNFKNNVNNNDNSDKANASQEFLNTNNIKKSFTRPQKQHHLPCTEINKATETINQNAKSVSRTQSKLQFKIHDDLKAVCLQKDVSWKKLLNSTNSKFSETTGSDRNAVGCSGSQSRLLLNRARWLMSRDIYRPGYMFCTSRRLKKRFASWSPRSNRVPSAASKATWWLTLALRKATATDECKEKRNILTEAFIQETRNLLSSNRTTKQRTNHKVRISDAPLSSVGLDVISRTQAKPEDETKSTFEKSVPHFNLEEESTTIRKPQKRMLPHKLKLAPKASDTNENHSGHRNDAFNSFDRSKNENSSQVSCEPSCVDYTDSSKTAPSQNHGTTSSLFAVTKTVLSSSSPSASTSSSSASFPNFEAGTASAQRREERKLSCIVSTAGSTPSVAATGVLNNTHIDALTCYSSFINISRNDQVITGSTKLKQRDSEYSNTDFSSPLVSSGKNLTLVESSKLMPPIQQTAQVFSPYIIDSRCFSNVANTARNSAVAGTAATGPSVLVFANPGHFNPNTNGSQPLVLAQPLLPSLPNVSTKFDAENDRESQSTNHYTMDLCCFIPSSATNGVLPTILQPKPTSAFMSVNPNLAASTTAVAAAPVYASSAYVRPPYHKSTPSRFFVPSQNVSYWKDKQVDAGVATSELTFSSPNDPSAASVYSGLIATPGMNASSSVKLMSRPLAPSNCFIHSKTSLPCLSNASANYSSSTEPEKEFPSSTPTASHYLIPSNFDVNASSSHNYRHELFYQNNDYHARDLTTTATSIPLVSPTKTIESTQQVHQSSSSAASSFSAQENFPVESASNETTQTDCRFWKKNKNASLFLNQPSSKSSQTEKEFQSKNQHQTQTTTQATSETTITTKIRNDSLLTASAVATPACYFSTWYCAPQNTSSDLMALSRSISNSICHFISSVDQELSTKTCPFRNKIISLLREEILFFLNRSPILAKYFPSRVASKKAYGVKPLDVIVYGSCSTNLALPWSDIDLTIMGLEIDSSTSNNSLCGGTFSSNIQRESTSSVVDPRHEILEHLSLFFSPVTTESEKHQQQKGTTLRCRTEILQYFSCQKLKPSRHTPILTLQFNPKSTGSFEIVNHVDISIHDARHTGLGAIRTLKFYLTFFPTMRPLILILKQVLMRRNMNVPYEGGLSSYALSLMVVAFLQSAELYGCRVFDVGYQLLNLLAFYGDIPVPSKGVVHLKQREFNPVSSTPMKEYVSTPTASKNDVNNRKITPKNSISSFNYYDVGIVTMSPEAFLQSTSCSKLLRLMSESYSQKQQKQPQQQQSKQQQFKEPTKRLLLPVQKIDDFQPLPHEKSINESFGPTLGGTSATSGVHCMDGTSKRSYAAVLAMSFNSTEKKNPRTFPTITSSSEQLGAETPLLTFSHETRSCNKNKELSEDIFVDCVEDLYHDQKEHSVEQQHHRNNQIEKINFASSDNNNLSPSSDTAQTLKNSEYQELDIVSSQKNIISPTNNNEENIGNAASDSSKKTNFFNPVFSRKNNDKLLEACQTNLASVHINNNINSPVSEVSEKSTSAKSVLKSPPPPVSSYSDNDNAYSEVFQLLSPYLKDDHFFGKRLDIRDPVNAVNNVGRPCWNVSGIKVVFAHAYRDLLTFPKCFYCAESYHLSTSPWTHKIDLQHDVSNFFTASTWSKNLSKLTKEMSKFYSTHVSLPPSPIFVPLPLSDHCSCGNILKMIL